MTKTCAIEIDSVSHSYGERVALRDVSLNLPAGILLGVLGPNGGGKTTLFRILSTLLRASSGSAKVFGHDTVREAEAVRRRLGMVFQSPALDDELTVRENAATHAALYGLRSRAFTTRFKELANAFGIDERAEDRVGTLSGGLKRRADLLRGLLHRPDLLLLDEPTVGLDPGARRSFWDVLSRLKKLDGTTMLVATHLMEEAERCEQVAIIDNGRIIALDTPSVLRGHLGDTAIWLEARNAGILADQIQTRFGFASRRVGGFIQVEHADPYDLLPALHEALGDLIESATIRKPTLEDVFLYMTGRPIDGETEPVGDGPSEVVPATTGS